MPRLAAGLATMLTALALGSPRAAQGQERSLFRGRASVLAGYVASRDQQSALDLDLPVMEADLRAGVAVHENVTLEGRLGGGAFLSSVADPGALLDLSVGAELGADFGVGRAWLALHLGAGLTGSLVRPVLRIGAGLDLHATDQIALGPVLQYGHVFHDDGTSAEVWHSDDAMFISFGLSMRISPVSRSEPPEPERAPLTESDPARRLAVPAAPAPPPPPPVEDDALMRLVDEAVRPEPRELVVPVLFSFDSTELIACSVASLHALRDYLDAHPEIEQLEIEGHADGSGTTRYNRALSERRAEAIRRWLIERGVDEERLSLAAEGESAPVETNDDERGRAQNRRARFRIVRERRE